MEREDDELKAGKEFEDMASEDAVVDGGEDVGEIPPKEDEEPVIAASERDKESKKFYAHADKESYYNSYEYLHKVTRTDKFGPIIKDLAGSPGKIVDMGSGTGLWTGILSGIGSVTGIDFSEERVAISRERNPGKEYIAGDLKEMPSLFTENSVGMFFSCCSLYCLSDESKQKVFEDCLKILSSGGKLIMIEPNKSNPFREKSDIKYPLDKKETKKFLETIGFRNVKIRNYNFIPRNFIRNRGILYSLLLPLEKIAEALQLPWSGTLVICAEKAPIQTVSAVSEISA